MRYLAISLLALSLSCGPTQDEIRAEIRSANTCTTASDCSNVGTYCPYGCNILVNKSQAERIRQLLESNHENNCAFDCIPLQSIACENQICVVK